MYQYHVCEHASQIYKYNTHTNLINIYIIYASTNTSSLHSLLRFLSTFKFLWIPRAMGWLAGGFLLELLGANKELSFAKESTNHHSHIIHVWYIDLHLVVFNDTPLKFNIAPWNMMLGRLLSFWEVLFSGAMSNVRGVYSGIRVYFHLHCHLIHNMCFLLRQHGYLYIVYTVSMYSDSILVISESNHNNNTTNSECTMHHRKWSTASNIVSGIFVPADPGFKTPNPINLSKKCLILGQEFWTTSMIMHSLIQKQWIPVMYQPARCNSDGWIPCVSLLRLRFGCFQK